MDAAGDGWPSHRSRIAERGRVATAGDARPVLPVDQAVLERIGAVDEVKLRAGRLERLRAELRRRDVAGALLTDPINMRYATGSRNMAVWTMHDGGRYAFVATEGPVVLFEFASSRHVSQDIETVDELRTQHALHLLPRRPARRREDGAVGRGDRGPGPAARRRQRRLAVDRCDPEPAQRLTARGVEPRGRAAGDRAGAHGQDV